MNYIFIGMGAIGTYIGGSLLITGNQVCFVDREEVREKYKANPPILVIGKSKTQIEDYSFSVGFDTIDFSKFEILVVAIKAFDTDDLIKSLLPYRENLPPILCLQNGVENEQKYRNFFGEQNVIAGTVTSAIGKIESNTIVVEKSRGTGIENCHPLSEKIYNDFFAAGLNPILYDNGLAMKWSKLLTNLLANASAAILNMSAKEIFNHKELFKFEMTQLLEAMDVMQFNHIPVVDLPKTPVKMLVVLARFIPRWLGRLLSKKILGAGRGGKMPSLHIDLHSGRSKSEVDFLNGAVSRAGEKIGLSTPVNILLTNTLTALVTGNESIKKFDHQPAALLKLLN